MQTMTQPRKPSEYQAREPEREAAAGLSFVDYLMGPQLRGYDWAPDRPPASAMQPHHQARNAQGFVHLEAGKPKMRRLFLSWVNGQVDDVPGVSCELVERAIAQARKLDPEAMAVFDWRRERPGKAKLTQTAFMLKHGIYSPGTLTKRFRKAVALVVELVCEAWGAGG